MDSGLTCRTPIDELRALERAGGAGMVVAQRCAERGRSVQAERSQARSELSRDAGSGCARSIAGAWRLRVASLSWRQT